MSDSIIPTAEAANWRAAHEWHAGLDLTYAGVDLGECMTYGVLTVIGRQWKQLLDGEKDDDGQPA